MSVDTKPGSRLYARCVKPLLEIHQPPTYFGHRPSAKYETTTVHGVEPGAACLMCETDHLDALEEHARVCARAERDGTAAPPLPPRPKRARLIDAPIYAALLAESRARGVPLRFSTDLTNHDRWGLAIAHGKGDARPFVWVLRESGTQLVPARAPEKGRPAGGSTPAQEVASFAGIFSGPLLYYACTGTAGLIAAISREQAIEWIRDECGRLAEVKG